MEKQIEVEVRTTTQCSFVPFTAVPDSWAGRKVKLVLAEDEGQPPMASALDELPWPV